MRKIVKSAYEDPDNSVDLFDGDRLNELGGMYCVAPAILYSQVDFEWKRYLEGIRRKAMDNVRRECKGHEHSWIFDGKSCCYRLRCPIPGCKKQTTVLYVKDYRPEIGEPVRILEDGHTMERIGSLVA